MDSFHPVLKIFYSKHLVSTVSTVGLIPFIRYWRFSTQTTLYQQCRHPDGFLSSGIEDFLLKPPCIDSVDSRIDSFHPVLKIFYSNELLLTVSTLGWIPFIRYWRFSTLTTLYQQCTQSDGFLSSSIEDFLLKPPCIDSVDSRMDSFHAVLNIFYSNLPLLTVLTVGWIPFIWYWRFSTQTTLYWQCWHLDRFLSSRIEDFLLELPCINSVDSQMDFFHLVLKIFYSNLLVLTVSTLGWIPFILYWRFSTLTTLYQQCTQSDGFLSSGIEDFLLKPPCINSVDSWIDSFHLVLNIF